MVILGGVTMADPMDVLTAKVDSLAQAVAEGFAGMGRRLDVHDAQFRDVHTHFAEMREYIEAGHADLKRDMARLEGRLQGDIARVEGRFEGDIGRVERKLDQFIDSQLRR